MFERTTDLHGETQDAWQHFMTAMMADKEEDDYFAYPALRDEMVQAGMWPAPV